MREYRDDPETLEQEMRSSRPYQDACLETDEQPSHDGYLRFWKRIRSERAVKTAARVLCQASKKVELEVLERVVLMALNIFEECEAPDDFCIQDSGPGMRECIVFGGWNRLTLSDDGWSVSVSHCTPRFVKLFNEKFGSREIERKRTE